ncbi:hypothetical protein F5X99DRAFT_397767 [Biscogniauxia marginata]|nr:hypothetical protein F5X99DRAFT_397767 [Biscogniauxia marginata]
MNVDEIAAQHGFAEEDMPDLLGTMAIQGFASYAEEQNLLHLDAAIRFCREALSRGGDGHPSYASWLSNLGTFLVSRFNETNNIADLDGAIQSLQQAIDVTTPEDPDREDYLNNLGVVLEQSYEATGDMRRLEDAIQISRQNIGSLPADQHEQKTPYLNNLANQLGRRYDKSGDIRDLEEAISLARWVVSLTLAEDNNLAGYLGNLGSKLVCLYKYTKEMHHLEEAIHIMRQSAYLWGEETHEKREDAFNSLKGLLKEKYKRTGIMKDLGEAVLGVIPTRNGLQFA